MVTAVSLGTTVNCYLVGKRSKVGEFQYVKLMFKGNQRASHDLMKFDCVVLTSIIAVFC